jgi:superfamily I DNA and RNA helicase
MPKQRMYIAESTVDDEQREIIQKRVDHSYIVQGCAGSGKSCLALLKIKMLSEMNAGEFYLIALVRSLVEYLRNELRDNKIPGERVITHREWINGHITDWCGKNFKIPAGQRQINKTPSFLLVDECQDLSMGDIRELKNAVTKQIFFYGDDEQQIMEFSHAPATIAEISRELNLPIYRLRYNYRLPKKVAAL